MIHWGFISLRTDTNDTLGVYLTEDGHTYDTLGFYLPEDIVDTHDTLGFLGTAVVDHSPLGDHPYVSPCLGKESILTGHHLSLSNHYKQTIRKVNVRYTKKFLIINYIINSHVRDKTTSIGQTLRNT